MKFDAIIMNPPYSQGLWSKCLEVASKYIKDDGELICLSPSAPLVQSTQQGDKFREILKSINCYDFDIINFQDNFENVNNKNRDNLGLYYCNKSKSPNRLFTEKYDILTDFEHSFLDLMKSDFCKTHTTVQLSRANIDDKFISKIDLNKYYFYFTALTAGMKGNNFLTGKCESIGVMSGEEFKNDISSNPRMINIAYFNSEEETISMFKLLKNSVILRWSILINIDSARHLLYKNLCYLPDIDYRGCEDDEELLKRVGYKGNPEIVINYIKNNFKTQDDWFNEVEKRIMRRR